MPRHVSISAADASWGVLRSGATENGKVLCSGFPTAVRCFDVRTGKAVGAPPPDPLGPPLDTAISASRAVWLSFDVKTVDIVIWYGCLTQGELCWPPLPSRLPGWLVWDYLTGSQVLKLPPKSQRTGLYGAPFVPMVALTPDGLWLAQVRKDTVLIYQLPGR